MIIYKRSFDENREIYFLHRKRKNFYCIFKTLEKVRNIKAGKNTKGGFLFLYAPVTLIDSIYRKDESYKCF